MTFALCLHGGAVARESSRLQPTDRRAIELALAAGGDLVAIEAVASRGSAPTAITEALAAGARRGIRLVDAALETADAHTTAFALAAVLDRLEVDLVIFGNDADPEGVRDVPAAIARHMSAFYLDRVVALHPVLPVGGASAAGTAIEITCAVGAWLTRLQLPLNAVLGIENDGRIEPSPAEVASGAGAGPSPSTAHPAVEVLSLADLEIESALVRRRHDNRGAIVATPRPLVTLHSDSAAIAIAALLRR